jgi:hypothetical protein
MGLERPTYAAGAPSARLGARRREIERGPREHGGKWVCVGKAGNPVQKACVRKLSESVGEIT